MSIEIPWLALVGGMLLGTSALLLLLFSGRIAGISGIVSGAMNTESPQAERSWRWLFLLGMVLAGLVTPYFGVSLPESLPVSNPLVIAIAGLLVGMGTRLGNGCTSGHGICGLGRLSKRSVVATGVFMAVAVITTYLRLYIV